MAARRDAAWLAEDEPLRIDGGDLAALSSCAGEGAGEGGAGWGKPVRILSCYEAGSTVTGCIAGWPSKGFNYEIDPVQHRGEPAGAAGQDRSDRSGEADAGVPGLSARRTAGVQHGARADAEEEDRKRRTRERERLLKERTAHSNRIKGLLHGQGIRDVMPLKPGFLPASRRCAPAMDGSAAAAEGGDRARARAAVLVEQADRRARGQRSGAAQSPRRTGSAEAKISAAHRSQGHRPRSAASSWSTRYSIAPSTIAARSAAISG